MNHVELMRPITKWAMSVPETRRLGEYVERLADLKPALERAFAVGRASLVNVKIGHGDFRKDALAV